MKQFDIKETGFNPSYYDLANMFNIYPDEEGYNRFSINRTLIINTKDKPAPNLFNIYTVKYGDSWTVISFNAYGTIELWWLICKFNDIKNPLVSPIEGEKLMIPTIDIANSIVELIRSK